MPVDPVALDPVAVAHSNLHPAPLQVKPPKLVIFDMDEVLCQYDLGCRLRSLAQLSGKTPRDIRAALWDSGFEGAADAGAYPDPELYLQAFAKRLGYPLTRDQWLWARREAMTAKRDVISLARQLSPQATLIVFTNNGPLVKYGFHNLLPEAAQIFAQCFCSYEFGTKKPDPLSYTRLLQHIGYHPHEAWFIDDKYANIEGAKLSGLPCHHFQHFTPLYQAAQALGFRL